MNIAAQVDTQGNNKQARQAFLLEYLEQHHYISIEEITRRFSVTTQTARRDIMALEATGRIRRLHGGATISTPIDPQIYRQRRLDQHDEKEGIAEFIANHLHDNITIFIDTGTTCEAIARSLVKHRQGLRIVTYSLRVASIISENSDFTLAIPGGFVRAVDGGICQEDTPGFISRFKFDYAVISVSSVDDDGDLCDDDHSEVTAVTEALKQSKCKLLAVDSSKFSKSALVKLGSLESVDMIVTNATPPEKIYNKIKSLGIELFLS